jgi:hypothetical protein
MKIVSCGTVYPLNLLCFKNIMLLLSLYVGNVFERR